MDAQTNELRAIYHRFLNTPAAREIEPKDLVEDLVKERILDDEEVALVGNERTVTKRQYCYFINILPTKGPAAKEIVDNALREHGYERAADELRRCSKPKEEPDVVHFALGKKIALKKVAAHRYAVHGQLGPPSPPPTDIAQEVEEQGAPAPTTVAFTTEQSTYQVASLYPELPAEPVVDLLRTDFVRVTAQSSRCQVQTEKTWSLESGEEIAQVVRAPGLTAPPPPLPSSTSDYGSAGITAQTPQSYFDATSAFRPCQDDGVAEYSINATDIDLDQYLDRGSFAVVYAARYKGKKVAVKKFRDYDEFSLAMFIEEVNIMKSLNHRNVVKFIGYVHSSDHQQLWLVTEYIPGGSMRRFCRLQGDKSQAEESISIREKARIQVECWQGLDYIHEQNLCHKDISSGNILVSNDLTQVKISDFGLAEFKNLMASAVTKISGTAMYYPPEFASENGVIRHPTKSDIYSMGASLCELFSEQWFWNINGQPRNQFQVMFKIYEKHRIWDQKREILYPDCWPNIPANVQNVLKDAIMPDHKARKTARELCIASQELLKSL